MSFLSALVPWAPVIGSVIGGLFSSNSAQTAGQFNQQSAQTAGEFSTEAARIAGEFNRDSAREQMHFAERMSATQHQREVADLVAAGLNPILSGTGGAGASSPIGSTALMPQASMPSASRQAVNFNDLPAAGVASSLAVRRNKAELDLLEEQADESRQRQWNINQQSNLMYEQQKEAYWKAKAAEELPSQAASAAEIARNAAKGAKLEGEIDSTKYGEFMRYLDRSIRSLTGTAKAIKP